MRILYFVFLINSYALLSSASFSQTLADCREVEASFQPIGIGTTSSNSQRIRSSSLVQEGESCFVAVTLFDGNDAVKFLEDRLQRGLPLSYAVTDTGSKVELIVRTPTPLFTLIVDPVTLRIVSRGIRFAKPHECASSFQRSSFQLPAESEVIFTPNPENSNWERGPTCFVDIYLPDDQSLLDVLRVRSSDASGPDRYKYIREDHTDVWVPIRFRVN